MTRFGTTALSTAALVLAACGSAPDLATLPDDGPTGGFFRDRHLIEW